MAMAAPRSHCALICLALLLPHTTSTAALLLHRSTRLTTHLPPNICVLATARADPSTGTGRLASSASTLSGHRSPPRHDASAMAPEDTTTAREVVAADDYDDAIPPPPPCCRASRVTPSSTSTALLGALPLLAVVAHFLPPPLAAMAALTILAPPVRAVGLSDDCFQLTHPTCAVYRYDNKTFTVDRARPLRGIRAACLHPLCAADSCARNLSTVLAQCKGRYGDPLHVYCTAFSLEAHGDKWRPVRALPVADPGAVVATGGDVCYVELAHLNYREGYFARCPAFDCSHVPFVECTEFPPDAVAAAVWERRRTTYRDTVGSQFVRYTYDA